MNMGRNFQLVVHTMCNLSAGVVILRRHDEESVGVSTHFGPNEPNLRLIPRSRRLPRNDKLKRRKEATHCVLQIMPRSRSARVAEIKTRLQTRLSAGVHRPGDRFPSAREVASRFGISYQTAHRLMAELQSEGLLERRAASGTFIPGGKVVWDGAHLFFSERARREASFGARLVEKLTRRLARDGVSFKLSLGETVKPKRNFFPVIWESPEALQACVEAQTPALLLNNRPAPGLTATWLDSVSIDDFSGGASAAQLLWGRLGQNCPDLAILGGPRDDARNQARLNGFFSIAPQTPVFEAGSWFFEDGFRVAPRIIESGARGVFCANDRLAEAILRWCGQQNRPAPVVVGFDDAPISERLGFTTIAIPWDEFIAGASELIKRRIHGDAGTARQLLLTPRPILRMETETHASGMPDGA